MIASTRFPKPASTPFPENNDPYISVPTRSEIVRFCHFTRENLRNGVLTKTCFFDLSDTQKPRKYSIFEKARSFGTE